MKLGRLEVLLFPDLARFDSKRQQRYAWAVAELAVVRRPAFWIWLTSILIVEIGISFSLPIWGVPMSMRGGLRGVLMLLAGLAYIALLWASRQRFRHSLRKQLVEDGIPICIKCGYDLRGSKDICPECGEGIERVMQKSGALDTIASGHDEPDQT